MIVRRVRDGGVGFADVPVDGTAGLVDGRVAIREVEDDGRTAWPTGSVLLRGVRWPSEGGGEYTVVSCGGLIACVPAEGRRPSNRKEEVLVLVSAATTE